MHVLRITPLFDWRAPGTGSETLAGAESVGGHAVQVRRLCEATAALGIEQTVLAPRPRDGDRGARLVGSVALQPVGLPGVRGVHRAQLAWLAGVLLRLPALRRAHFDAVHVHASGLIEPLLAALAARAILRLPCILTLHHSAQATYVPQSRRDAVVQVLTRRAERAAVGRSARTLALTRRSRERLGAQGRVEILPDCVDVERFTAWADPQRGAALAAAAGVPEGAPLALYAGRISREKGWRALLEVAREVPDLHVLVCGDGPERAAMAEAAGARVHFAGAVDPAGVAAAMARADVLVLPSVLEELGSVLIEAMAVGLVSVAYATGGVAEAVEDGVTGLLVPAGDVAALVAAVRRTLEDESLRRRAREAGPRLARERFDAGAVAARLAAVYADVVARPG